MGADASGEVRVELRDGMAVVVRPIRPGDREAVRLAFEHLSDRSRYQRFLAPMTELSEGQLRYLTEVDHHDHEALIAFDAETGEGVGVGRFVRLGDGASAEAAITVIDAWQGRGVGKALAALLADRARAEGIERLTSLLLASNRQMLDLLASLGPSETTADDGATVEVAVALPEEGIGDHMASVLRVAAGGTVELATPPWGLQIDEDAGGA